MLGVGMKRVWLHVSSENEGWTQRIRKNTRGTTLIECAFDGYFVAVNAGAITPKRSSQPRHDLLARSAR